MLGVGLVLEQPCAIWPPNVAPAMLAQTTRAFGVPTTLKSCCISRPTGRVATPAPCTATPSSAPDALPPWPSSSGSSGLLKRPVRPEPPEPSSSSAAGDSSTKASAGGRSGGSRRSNHRRTGTQRPSRASPAPQAGGGDGPSTSGSSGAAAREAPAMRVLGVDYGTKWTGLAVGINASCDPLQVIPSGSSTADLAKQLVQMAQDRDLQGIVVGLPINPHVGNTLTDPSSDTPIARRCRDLANVLAILGKGKGIQVYLYDEASTSADARMMIGVKGSELYDGFSTKKDKQKHQEDAVSAMVLVRRYLNVPGLAVRVRLRGG